MLVNQQDGACRSCGGQLQITDVDDCTMTVLCTAPGCGDSYDVELDAFGDGGLHYSLGFISEQLRGGGQP